MAGLFFLLDVSITVTAAAGPDFNAKHKAKRSFVRC